MGNIFTENPDILTQRIIQDVWADKYKQEEDNTLDDTYERIGKAIMGDESPEVVERTIELLKERVLVPAGRIWAGAGTNKRVTLINCFVSNKIADSLDSYASNGEPHIGILDSLKNAALTQQMGGGIGMDFSTVRPEGAIVKRTGSVSSGIIPFMDMWDSMCKTIMSSGSRRGAMMGTLHISHPDIIEFITAKSLKGKLKNFNVSVLVSDAFMKCLKEDGDWDLVSKVPREDGNHVEVREGEYVYKRIKAKKLWETIIEHTYIHAEPGVIFIDRVNQQNNLNYCEEIAATNPCGEQPLPPYGDCDLGHINLAALIDNPFKHDAKLNLEKLAEAVTLMVRFLDNVLDKTLFPLEEQKREALIKRRIGLGYTGLATALQFLKVDYGSQEAVELTREWTKSIATFAYNASADLAEEKGPFPLYSTDILSRPFIKKLPKQLSKKIATNGLRNGVLMSIAPTGTTSIVSGNMSSGIEPMVMKKYKRNVLAPDGETFNQYDVYDLGYLAFCRHHDLDPTKDDHDLPSYMTKDINNLTVDEHLQMQAASQEWVDASISKTVNCPESMIFKDFMEVYSKAYDLGLKGSTTYRPDPRSYRGSVIELDTKKEESNKQELPKTMIPMEDVLEGRRYRIKWPGEKSAYYVIINDYFDENGVRKPFEIFLASKSAEHDEWTTALTLMITGIFRRGGDVSFIPEELKQVTSTRGGTWKDRKYVNSLVAAIGHVIEQHFEHIGYAQYNKKEETVSNKEQSDAKTLNTLSEACPACGAPSLMMVEGCKKCMNCGYSSC